MASILCTASQTPLGEAEKRVRGRPVVVHYSRKAVWAVGSSAGSTSNLCVQTHQYLASFVRCLVASALVKKWAAEFRGATLSERVWLDMCVQQKQCS